MKLIINIYSNNTHNNIPSNSDVLLENLNLVGNLQRSVRNYISKENKNSDEDFLAVLKSNGGVE